MRLCVFGAGAIGSVLSARLARAGSEVVMVARGPHAAAIAAHGLTIIDPDRTRWTQRLKALTDAAAVGPVDAVLVTMKAHAQPKAAADLARFARAGAQIVLVQNGIPWWYFQDLDGTHRDRVLPTLDPGGVLAAAIPPTQRAGGVIYLAAAVVEPGLVQHHENRRLVVGRPDGRIDPALTALRDAFGGTDIAFDLPGDLRPEIWNKVTANLAFNTMAVLTGATLGALVGDDATFAVGCRLTEEALAVAASVGCTLTVDMAVRRARGLGMTHFKASTLQDLEAGRPLELDALIGVVAEIGRLTGVATPTIDVVLALARSRATVAGCLA